MKARCNSTFFQILSGQSGARDIVYMQNQPSPTITSWFAGDDTWQKGIDEEFRCESHIWRERLDHGEAERQLENNDHRPWRVDHLPQYCPTLSAGRKQMLFVVNCRPEPRLIACKEMSPAAMLRRHERDEYFSR
jgi:hypothetical protein